MSKYDLNVVQRRAALLLAHRTAIGGSPEPGPSGMATKMVVDTVLGLMDDPQVNDKIQIELDGRIERHRRVWRLDEHMPRETASA